MKLFRSACLWVVVELSLLLSAVGRAAGLCRCGHGSYCPIFATESDADCYCQLSAGLYRQDPTGTCTSLEDHCASATCANGGTCRPSFGSYFCDCPPNFGGQTCNLPVTGSKKYARGVRAYFDVHEQSLGRGITFFIWADEVGERPRLSLDDGAGWVRTGQELAFASGEAYTACLSHAVSIPDADLTICERMMPKGEGRYVAKAELRFPLVGSDDPRILTSVGGSPIGRTDTIRLTFWNGDEETFSQEYTVFTHFTKSDITCAFLPIISHCSSSSSVPVKYSMGSVIVLRAVSRPLQGSLCSLITSATYTWRIKGPGVDMVVRGDSVLRLPGSSLNFGQYTVECSLDVLASKMRSGFQTKHYLNFNRCWLEVRPVAVVAGINGGSLRTIRRGEYLDLSTGPSYDPNYHDRSRMRYLWGCDNQRVPFCTRERPLNRWKQVQLRMPLGLQTFTLHVSSEGLDSSYSRVFTQKVDVRGTGTVYPDFFIACCQGSCLRPNPSRPLCLKLYKYPQGESFAWTYRREGGTDSPISGIAQPGTPPHQVIIRSSALDPDTTYYFTATYADSVAEFMVTTTAAVVQGSCDITPGSGTAVTTEFTVACQGFRDSVYDSEPLTIEIYEKQSSQQDVLISSSRAPKVSGLLLSSGQLTVKVLNSVGGFVKQDLSVWLRSGPVLTADGVSIILKQMYSKMREGDVSSALACMNYLAANIGSVSDQNGMVGSAVNLINQIDLYELSDTRQILACLHFLLSAVSLPEVLNSTTVRDVGLLLEHLSSNLISNSEHLLNLPPEDPISLTEQVLGIAEPLFSSKGCQSTNNGILPINYESCRLEYWIASMKIVNAVEIVGNVLLGTMFPYQKPIAIKRREVSMLTKVVKGDLLMIKTDIDPSGADFVRLSFDEKFASAYKKDILEVQVTEVKKNPFWWQRDEIPANSRQVAVRIRLRSGKQTKDLHELRSPVDMIFKVKDPPSASLSSSVSQPKEALPEEQKDMLVSIFKIDRPNAGSGVMFLDFKDLGTTELLVLLVVNEIPGAKQILTQGGRVNGANPTYIIHYTKRSVDDLLYLGVIPGSGVIQGETVNFSFEIQDEVCRVWRWDRWDLGACEIRESRVKDEVHCRCQHLSLFGASILVPPILIHPIHDIHLFRKIINNLYIPLLVAFFYILYFIFFFWAQWMDKKDIETRGIHVLPDNFPGDRYGYLLAVFTGAMVNSGTTSNVGVRLLGTKAASHAHIINHNKHFLQRGQDSWFLLFSQEHLGEIQMLHVWHDSSGPQPDWFCNKIMVYDLTDDHQYWFLIDNWLRAEEGETRRLEWQLTRISKEEERKEINRDLARDNFIAAFRESHLWFSIFARHPRSDLSRLQRLTIALLIVLLSMLCTMMFYGVKNITNGAGEDVPRRGLGLQDVMILLQVFIISLVATSIARLLFEYGKNSEKEGSSENKHWKTRLLKLVMAKISGFWILAPLNPVRLSGNLPRANKRNVFLYVAWIVSWFIILTCSFFLIFYGLKYGANRSLILSGLLLSNFLSNLVVYQPAKIAFFSITGALFCKISNRESITFEINPDTTRVDAELSKNPEFMRDLIALRSKPMYHPLSLLESSMELQRKKGRKEARNTVNFIFVAGIYLIIILIVLAVQVHATAHHTQHIYRMFATKKLVYSKESFFQYMMNSLLPTLHVSKWYNGDLLPIELGEEGMQTSDVKGWTPDYMNKLVGVPRLRQLRVTKGTCSVPTEMASWFEDCDGPLSPGNVETGSFGEFWGEGLVQGNFQPFIWNNYASAEASETMPVFGASRRLYPGGGYIQNMTEGLQDSLHELARLYLCNWLDRRTRALFVEFNLFSANSNLFAQVSLVVETLASGVYTTKFQVNSSYHQMEVEDDVFLVTILGIFIIILAVSFIRLIMLASSSGLVPFIKNWGNLGDSLIIFFGVLCFGLSHYRSIKFREHSGRFLKPLYIDTYISFTIPFWLDDVATIFFCVLVVITTVRLITLCHYGKYFVVTGKALKDSVGYIVAMGFLTQGVLIMISVPMYICGFQHSVLFPIHPFPRKHFAVFEDRVELPNESMAFPILVNIVYHMSAVLMMCILSYQYGRARFSVTVLGYGSDYTNRFDSVLRCLKKMKRGSVRKEKTSGGLKLNGSHRRRARGQGDFTDAAERSLRIWLARSTERHEKISRNLDLLIKRLQSEVSQV